MAWTSWRTMVSRQADRRQISAVMQRHGYGGAASATRTLLRNAIEPLNSEHGIHAEIDAAWERRAAQKAS